MSAYICDHSHINAIAWYIHENIDKTRSLEVIAFALYETNFESVKARYRDHKDESSFHFQVIRGLERIDPKAWVGSFACYRYQACEHSGWEASLACHWTLRALARLAQEVAKSDCWGAPQALKRSA